MVMESIQFVHPLQGATNVRELNRMRQEGALTDVTLIADRREFECHRAVLAASCPYFKAMFSTGLRETNRSSIKLFGVTAESLDVVLEFAYTGTCVLTKRNAEDVLRTADLIGMLPLRDASAKFMMSCMDVTNCLQIRQIGQDHCLEELLQQTTTFCKKNFADIVHQEQFLILSLDQVVEYLGFDDLNVVNEGVVYDAAIRWVKYDPEERMPFAAIVIDCVRLPFVDPNHLRHQANMDPTIYEKNTFLKQILERKTERKPDELKNVDFVCLQRKPRLCTSKEVLAVFGGEIRAGTYLGKNYNLFCYHCDTEKWETIEMKTNSIKSEAFSTAAIEFGIYITGGIRNNKASSEVHVYLTYTNKWQSLPKMNTARYHHACVTQDNMLYAVGGTDGKRCLADVERYSPFKNEWKVISSLVCAVKCPAVVAYSGKLYVFGGFTDTYAINQAVQIYEPKEDSWTSIYSHSINHACAYAAPLNDKVYLLGGCAKTMKVFNPSTYAFENGPDMPVKRGNCAVAVVNGKLYVTGGVPEPNASSLRSVECYCPIAGKWETLQDMPHGLYRHNAVKIRTPLYPHSILRTDEKRREEDHG